MTQPEYRVIQALLASGKNEARDEASAKESYVDQVLASIQAGTAFEEAVSATEPYPFTGGDLGWRKLGDIPSMFAEVVPTLSIGEVAKVQSSSGFHLVYLADALGGERLVKQTNVRHILIKPTEVLNETAAEELAGNLVERIRGGRILAHSQSNTLTTLALQPRVVSWAGPTPGKWCQNLRPPWPMPSRAK